MCSKIGNVSEGSPNVVDRIRAGKVDLIINTSRSKQGRRDGYEIRHAAVDFGVPYIRRFEARGCGRGCDHGCCREGWDGSGVDTGTLLPIKLNNMGNEIPIQVQLW